VTNSLTVTSQTEEQCWNQWAHNYSYLCLQ